MTMRFEFQSATEYIVRILICMRADDSNFQNKKDWDEDKRSQSKKKKISIKLEAEWIIQILIFVVNPLLVLQLVIVSRGQKGNSAH